ncbi:hypothetical protein [Shimazuella alba]|uniref:Uncharacterized protein n=1 Tax=Shimazuella alba TaxID=2690964 RepID=A0A6I4VY39_9BACL|nr:hypothetical protein [Shimazuella alba]MXQ54820.1 hypothetical protein [Shimazuella alba]
MRLTVLRRQDENDSLLPDDVKEFVCQFVPDKKKKKAVKTLIPTYKKFNKEQRYRFQQVMRLLFPRLGTDQCEKTGWQPGLPIQESIQITARFAMLSKELEEAVKLSLLKRASQQMNPGRRPVGRVTYPSHEVVVLLWLYEEDTDRWDTDNRISQFKHSDYTAALSKLDEQQRQELELWITVFTVPPCSKLVDAAHELLSV